jgi:hypothetical protein
MGNEKIIGSVPKYAFSFTIFSNLRYSEKLQKIFFQKQEDVFLLFLSLRFVNGLKQGFLCLGVP